MTLQEILEHPERVARRETGKSYARSTRLDLRIESSTFGLELKGFKDILLVHEQKGLRAAEAFLHALENAEQDHKRFLFEFQDSVSIGETRRIKNKIRATRYILRGAKIGYDLLTA